MLWQRLLFGSLLIAALFGLLALDAYAAQPRPSSGPAVPWSTGLPVTVTLAAIGVLASIEMAQMCRAGGHQPVSAWAAFVTAGLLFVPWLEMQVRVGSVNPAMSSVLRQMSPTVVWITGGLIGSCLLILARRTTERALSNIAATALIFLYLGLFGSFLARIRCMDPTPAGAILLVYVVATIKAGDIGAYLTGLAIGRHKLAPWLSPGKTIEGAIGALAGAMLVAVAGMVWWNRLPWTASRPLTIAQAALLGALMAVVGHLGDLVESAFKRDMKVKDSGHLIPSFGGLLDLLDSPFFAAPVAWMALTFWLDLDYN